MGSIGCFRGVHATVLDGRRSHKGYTHEGAGRGRGTLVSVEGVVYTSDGLMRVAVGQSGGV